MSVGIGSRGGGGHVMSVGIGVLMAAAMAGSSVEVTEEV